MNMHDRDAFAKAFNSLDATDDPKEIREAFEQDQAAIDEIELYRAPDGEYFEVARRLPCGTVITDAGRWISPEDFTQCKEVTTHGG